MVSRYLAPEVLLKRRHDGGKFETCAKSWVSLYLSISYLNVSVFSIPELQRCSISLLASTKWIVVD